MSIGRILLIYTLAFHLTIGLAGQSSDGVVGMWQVINVQGQESMTPDGRWMQFNADGTQESGNGWKKHSQGRWSLDGSELTIEDDFGWQHPFGPFSVKNQADTMYWTRVEDGMEIDITLVRIETLPTRAADELIGIWTIMSWTEADTFKKAGRDYNPGMFLTFRWDGVVVMGRTEFGRLHGVYQTNGHRPQLNIFWYGEEIRHERYRYEISQGELSLSLMEGNRVARKMVFHRNQHIE